MSWGLLTGGLAWLALWTAGRLWDIAVQYAAFMVVGLTCGVALGWTEWRSGIALPRWKKAMLQTASAYLVALSVCFLIWREVWLTLFANVPWFRLSLLLGLALLLLRHMVWLAIGHGATGWQEIVRLMVVLALTPLTTWAYFTPRFVGGVDARWYGYALADFVEQLRAGVFPVLIGQGQYAFNGPVHPYRSAPMFQNLGGLLDWLTERSLGIFALQHLTVIGCSMAAALFAYWAIVRMAPRRRWMALMVASAYATSPGILGLVATQEMYMSYMAAPWLPLLAGAVTEAAVWRRWSSYIMAAFCMAVLWWCHSPIALWAGVTAVAVLGLTAVGRQDQTRAWFSLVVMGLLTGWLLYFHYINVGEFVGQASVSALREQWMLGVVAIAMLATGLWAVQGWLVAAWLALGSALIVWWKAPAWAVAVTVVVAGAGLVRWCRRRRIVGCTIKKNRHGWWCLSLAVALVAGALCNSRWGAAISVTAQDTASFTRNFWPGIFQPITESARLSDLQPGWAAWGLATCATVAGLLGARRLAGSVVLLALMGLLLFPLFPVVSQLWGLLPIDLLVATSGAVNLRLTPVWVTLMCFAGFGGVVWLEMRWPRLRGMLLAGLLLAVGWNILQVQHFNRRLVALTHSAVKSDDLLQTENAPLAIYNYNFLGIPGYFSHGVMDYHAESRLLHVDGSTVLEDQAIGQSLPVREERLVATVPSGNGSYRLGSDLQLAPAERLRLRFAFPDSALDGMLILDGQHFYREYILPSSGGEKSFGAGPKNSHDLMVWNSQPEPIAFTLHWVTSRQITAGGEPFAAVSIFADPVDFGPVITHSLIPYRVTITSPQAVILETPRRYITGYEAFVNGVRTAPIQTLTGQLGIPVPAGQTEVTVAYKGTPAFWRAGWISLVGVLLVLTALIVEGVRGVQSAELRHRK